jgi:hypothetical protein
MNSTSDADETRVIRRAPERTEAMIRSLRKLLEGDLREQKETFEYLKNALEQDCQSDRRLFQ